MAARIHGEPPFTYADLRRWPEDERWELIDGQAFAMTSPSRQHQRVVTKLAVQLDAHFGACGCEVYVAPFDVRLPRADEPDDAIETVVQSDLVVVCDRSKLDDRGCRGAPDLVVEVISPSTATRDYVTKRDLYERCGAREYWLVHPLEHHLTIYRRGEDGAFVRADPVPATGKLPSPTFTALVIDWDTVFGDVSDQQ